jgi:hypothetical protein
MVASRWKCLTAIPLILTGSGNVTASAQDGNAEFLAPGEKMLAPRFVVPLSTALALVAATTIIPAFAESITDPSTPGAYDGANGANGVGGPGANGVPGGNASATANAPADASNTAIATGGKGGNGGAGDVGFNGGNGGAGGKASAIATTSTTATSITANATANGGNAGNGGTGGNGSWPLVSQSGRSRGDSGKGLN